MSTISTDLINRISGAQNQIWQTVSQTVSEALGEPISFGSPLTVAAQTSDLYAELSTPLLVIQFALASAADHAQAILIPQESLLSLASLAKGTPITDVDENLIADIRAPLESIVQGICLGVGSITNEMAVATGLSIRYQIFSFPPNLQRCPELVRTQVAASAEDVNGTIIWLMDPEACAAVLGLNESEGEADQVFSQLNGDAAEPGTRQDRPALMHTDDNNPLDLLMDIPLEISVELGRVRMLVKDVIELGTGSIVEIEKAAGEPVDVLVNGRTVARGEVVVIDDNFGVRITEILNPAERLGKLNEAA